MSPSRRSSAPTYPRPPLKIQGGKTRLLPQLLPHLRWVAGTAERWVEPFVGGGSITLAKAPKRALLADANPHLIAFYNAVLHGDITGNHVVTHLQAQADAFASHGEAHYYRLRERFNSDADPLDLLALNHCAFNGIMRFNSRGDFNTPFCRDPQKLTVALIDSVAARVAAMRLMIARNDWRFVRSDWRDTLESARPDDFVYLDSPYFGRSAGYYTQWPESQARELAAAAKQLPCRWALSDWLVDTKGQRNELLAELYPQAHVVELEHRYVLGRSAASRGRMTEALLLSDD